MTAEQADQLAQAIVNAIEYTGSRGDKILDLGNALHKAFPDEEDN